MGFFFVLWSGLCGCVFSARPVLQLKEVAGVRGSDYINANFIDVGLVAAEPCISVPPLPLSVAMRILRCTLRVPANSTKLMHPSPAGKLVIAYVILR